MATVLVVEDDPDMREIERMALSGEGHEVLMASNGREGLKTLERTRPCVILLDLMMPVMDGLTFLAERQRRGVSADVPVVCVSAAGPQLVGEAINLGAKECIEKPVRLEEIVGRVAHYCT